jgi:hypothetical protein
MPLSCCGNNALAAAVLGFLSARIRRSSSRRSPGCGAQSCFVITAKRLGSALLNAVSSSFDPQLDASAMGRSAPSISASGNLEGGVEIDGLALAHRLRRARALEDLREVAALVADPRPVDSGLSSGVTRSILALRRGSSALSFHSGLRCQIWTVQPRAQPGQTEGVGLRYQTRALYRNGFDNSAPTGQRSMMLSEYGSASSGRSSAARTSEVSPRWTMPSAFDLEISRVKRTQREQRMQRSLSSTMRSESGWNLVERTLTSCDTDGSPLYL